MREYTTEAKYVIGEDETIITSLQELVQKRPKLVLFTRPKNCLLYTSPSPRD